MNTSEALEASILHWQENVAAENPEDVDVCVGVCALCSVYYSSKCDGCPVKIKTGYSYCSRSPYADAVEQLTHWAINHSPKNAAAWREAAQAELDFLISLREPKA